MARIRTIKPEFAHSESMGRISRDARLCFVMMWTIADDAGRLRGASRMLASLLFPYDDDAPKLIDSWLCELEDENCIVRYLVDGSQYIQIVKWLEHQKIDRPSASKIPEFDEGSRIVSNDREGSCEDLDLGPRTKDQERANALVVSDDVIEAINAYNAIADKAGLPIAQRITDKRKSAVKARLRECGGLDGWHSALAKLEASDWCCGRADRSDGWKADLDFLTQSKSFTRLMEGFYDNRSGHQKRGQSSVDRLKAGAAAFMAHDVAGGPDAAGYG